MHEIFISHASADDPFVAELREQLEKLQSPVWVDSRNLSGGSKLGPEIEKAIEEAEHFIVVLSPNTINSPWVRREIEKALAVEKSRGDGYRVIPLLLPGITSGALGTWFDEELVGVIVFRNNHEAMEPWSCPGSGPFRGRSLLVPEPKRRVHRLGWCALSNGILAAVEWDRVRRGMESCQSSNGNVSAAGWSPVSRAKDSKRIWNGNVAAVGWSPFSHRMGSCGPRNGNQTTAEWSPGGR